MGKGQRDRGLPVRTPVFRSGATTAGAVFDEEPPSHRWLSCRFAVRRLVSVPDIICLKYVSWPIR